MRPRSPSGRGRLFLDPSERRLAFPALLTLLAAGILLSYVPMPLVAQLWTGCLGILAPLALLLFAPSTRGPQKPKAGNEDLPGFTTETLELASPGAWWGVGLLFGALWLYRLFLVHAWPVPDEGLLASEAAELAESWKWNFFFSPAQHPPLFIWSLAFLFKAVPPSLFWMRFFPLFWTGAAFALSYRAGRFFLSRSASFFFLVLNGFSFWPLFVGRICGYMAPLYFWETLCLAALGWYLREPSRVRPQTREWILGTVTALGFGWAIAWPLAAALMSLFLYAGGPLRLARKRPGWAFGLPVLLAATLWAAASVLQDNGRHILFLLGSHSPGGLLRRLSDSFSNFSAILWGCDLQSSYGPVWGGMLDPILGAFFLFGTAHLARRIQKPGALWVLGAFLALMLPGLATANFDIFRDSLALPFLLLMTAFGIGQFLVLVPVGWRAWGLAFLLGASAALDLVHLKLSYEPGAYGSVSNVPPQGGMLSQAYGVLDQWGREKGPGAVLLDLTPDLDDQTLAMATFGFNCFLNPRLSPEKARWFAVLVDMNLEPFLEARFPRAWCYSLGTEDRSQGWKTLMVLPMDRDEDRGVLASWSVTAGLFHRILTRTWNYQPVQAHEEALQLLEKAGPSIPNDPFLRSCYWEAIYENHNWQNRFGDHDTKAHFPAAFHALQMAIQEGYPTAYFYNELGSCYALVGDDGRARQAFEKALHAPLNLTPAADNLKALGAMEKNSMQGEKEKRGTATR